MNGAGGGRPGATLVAMCVAQAMVQLDTTIVNVALPVIQRALGVTPANLEWTINAYVLALAALIVTGGTLGDRFGRKRMLLDGLAVNLRFSMAFDAKLGNVTFRYVNDRDIVPHLPPPKFLLVECFPLRLR